MSKSHSPVQFLSVLSSYFDLHLPDSIVYLSVVSKLGRKNIIYGVTAQLNCWENYVSHRVFILLIFIVSHGNWIHWQCAMSGVASVASHFPVHQHLCREQLSTKS